MTALKMSFHNITKRRIVEVFDNNGIFVAAIYPDDDLNGIRIISSYITNVIQDDGSTSKPPIPAVGVLFRRKGR